VRKLWTLGALVTACAFGWRQGFATQSVELSAADGPLVGAVPKPRPTGAADRAVRRVVLRQAWREMIAPSTERSEAPLLPSMLEALLSQRISAGQATGGAEPMGPGEALALSPAEHRLGVPRGAQAKGTASDALDAAAALFDPSSAKRPVLH
jgi:hypothetical protein